MKKQGDSPPKRPKRNTEIRGERGWGEKGGRRRRRIAAQSKKGRNLMVRGESLQEGGGSGRCEVTMGYQPTQASAEGYQGV